MMGISRRAASIVVVGLALCVPACSSGPVTLTRPNGVATTPGGASTATPTPAASTTPSPAPTKSAATPSPTASPTATASPITTATPTPVANTAGCVTAPEPYPSAGGAVPVPAPSGYSVSVQLPANNAPAGATITVTGCAWPSAPAAVAGTDFPEFLSAVGGTPVFYVEATLLSTPVTVNLSSTVGISATLPPAVIANAAGAQFYVTGCVQSACADQPLTFAIGGVIGPVPVSGNTVAIDSNNPELAAYEPPGGDLVPGGVTVIALLYTSPDAPGLQFRHIRFAHRH